jgi:hypothetical protein
MNDSVPLSELIFVGSSSTLMSGNVTLQPQLVATSLDPASSIGSPLLTVVLSGHHSLPLSPAPFREWGLQSRR